MDQPNPTHMHPVDAGKDAGCAENVRFSLPHGSRDAQFDNCKLLLIWLMVLGHTFEQFRADSTVISVLFGFIYLFHMEAFVLLAGYHSKNVEKCRDTAVERFLLPYIIFNFFSYVFIALIGGKRLSLTGFQLFSPHSTMWFLFSMFVWKILLKDLARIRYALPLSILLGLGMGMFTSLGMHYAFTRVFTFLPFFLMGYLMQPEHLDRIRRLPRCVGYIALSVVVAAAILLFGIKELPPGILYLSHSYGYYEIGLTGHTALWAAMGLRALIYLLAAVMIAALFILVPRKSGKLTKLGRNTMTVYLLHFFVIRIFKKAVPVCESLPLCLLLCVAVSLALTGILSLPACTRGYEAVMRFFSRALFQK